MRPLLLRRIKHLYTSDSAKTVLANAWILCSEGKIKAFGREPCPIDPAAVATTREMESAVVLPGLINLHHHFFQSVTRAVPATLGAFGRDWIAALYPLWRHLTPDDMATAATVAAGELALTGVTTSVDHAFLTRPPHEAFVAAQIEAVGAVGLRLHLVHGGITNLGEGVPERLRPILGDAIESFIDSPDAIMARIETLAARHHQSGAGSRVALGVGPLGLAYDSGDLMQRMAAFAAEIGAHLHTHMHPRASERVEAEAHWGVQPLAFLDRAGWLRPGTSLTHGTGLRPDEVRLMAERGVALIHCPRTVIRLGYPVPPIGEWSAMGLKVGIGVDGVASNDGGGLLPDLRLALLLHRVAQAEASTAKHWLTADDLLHAATRGAAEVLGRSDIGCIAPGNQADLAAFDLAGIAYAGSIATPIERLLFAGVDGHAALTVCGGRIIAERGTLTGIDLAAAGEAGDRVAARIAAAAGP